MVTASEALELSMTAIKRTDKEMDRKIRAIADFGHTSTFLQFLTEKDLAELQVAGFTVTQINQRTWNVDWSKPNETPLNPVSEA